MGILKYILSYGLLLLVVLAALYFSRSLDPQDLNPKLTMRMNPP
jgi:hypothetical protein